MNKITLFGVIGIFIVFNILSFVFLLNQEKQISSVTGSVVRVKEPFLEKSEEDISQDYFLVTYVVDGDTVEIETKERVRLICIDSPERGEEFYKESKKYLEELVLDKKVKLVKDISETDKYKRLLRYLYLEDGSFVNEKIVRSGYAKVYSYEPDISLCSEIKDAEDYAKENNLGIWGEIKEEEEDEEVFIGEYDCSSNVYNCGDFSSHEKAQEVFLYCGGVENDVHYLDGDSDGVACESL